MSGKRNCSPCPKGKYCPASKQGGTAIDCPAGLATIADAALSVVQCMTLPGYGRLLTTVNNTVSVASQRCPTGTYNGGGNTMACQSCPPGLTTREEGATAASMCVAPPGSFVKAGGGAKCPIGTFTTQHNTNVTCQPCGPGLSTAAEGSSSPAACIIAARGYFLKADLSIGGQDVGDDGSSPEPFEVIYTAQMCPKNTYQDSESMAKSCKSCPNGLQTQLEGATGVHLCLAPPGMELKPGAAVPTAWFHGIDTPNSNLRVAKCMACPANMVTPDVISGVSPAGGYTSSADCVNRPGHGMSALNQISEKCEIGSWSAGLSRGECIPCPGGFTTLTEGSTSGDACVVQPGWAVSNTSGALPAACPPGTYSIGGTPDNRYGSCTACPTGFTTQEDASTSSADCSRSSCIMIRYYSADDASQLARNNTSRCQLLMAADGSSTNTDASRAVVGFKAYTQGVVLDFALYYIPGQLMMGKVNNTVMDCPFGLATITKTAVSVMQCMTLPGYGRTLTLSNNTQGVSARRCLSGTYNAGGNAMDCLSCPQGLTTMQEGATAASMCGELHFYNLNVATGHI
eukprot:gene5606-5844_t